MIERLDLGEGEKSRSGALEQELKIVRDLNDFILKEYENYRLVE